MGKKNTLKVAISQHFAKDAAPPIDKQKMEAHKLADCLHVCSNLLRIAFCCVALCLRVPDKTMKRIMADFAPKTPDWFQTRRAAQVVAFFGLKAGGKINILRATKLVYLADRLSMELRDHPITNDSYVSMPFGPVNTHTYDYMNGRASQRQEEWAIFVGKRVEHDLPVTKGIKAEALDELSRSDTTVLEKTWEMFSDIEKYELAEWTHKFCPEWVDPKGSSSPIDFSTIYKKIGKSDPHSLADELKAERKLADNLFSR